METVKKKRNILGFVVVIVMAIIGIWYLFGGGLEQQAVRDLKKIEVQVAQDAEKAFKIALESGNDMDAYVQAGLVAAAYLQANDTDNYKKWNEVEKTLAKKVGLDF
jgi:hypothetical protein